MVVSQTPWLTPPLFPNFVKFCWSHLSCKEQRGDHSHWKGNQRLNKDFGKLWLFSDVWSASPAATSTCSLLKRVGIKGLKLWNRTANLGLETVSSRGHRCLFNKHTDELKLKKKKENQYFTNERKHQEISKNQHCTTAENWIITSTLLHTGQHFSLPWGNKSVLNQLSTALPSSSPRWRVQQPS